MKYFQQILIIAVLSLSINCSKEPSQDKIPFRKESSSNARSYFIPDRGFKIPVKKGSAWTLISKPDYIDPIFEQCYSQLDYIAIGYAILGGIIATAQCNNFKNRIADLQYDFSTNENIGQVDLSTHWSNNLLKQYVNNLQPNQDFLMDW